MLDIYDAHGNVYKLAFSGKGDENDPFILLSKTEQQLDLLGAIVTSEETTVASYTQALNGDTELWDTAVFGGATATWEKANGGYALRVFEADQHAIRQSKLPAVYMAGVPLHWAMSTIDMTPVTGVVKRYGYGHFENVPAFTGGDGFFLITDDTTIWAKILKGGNTVFEKRREEWYDPLDGSGPSRKVLNPEMFQVIGGSFLYFGGTSATFDFVLGGAKKTIHEFENANVLQSTFVESPFQPLHVSISRHSGSGEAKTYQICSKIGVLGNTKLTSRTRMHPYNLNGVRTISVGAATGAIIPLLCVKKATKLKTIKVVGLSGYTISAEDLTVFVIRNPVFSGSDITYVDTGYGYFLGYGASNGSSFASGTDIVLERDVATSGGAAVPIELGSDNLLLHLGDLINGSSEVVAICVKTITSNVIVKVNVSIEVEG